MTKFLIPFIRDERGFAAEFALVLPLLVLFILGTIDVGMYAWRLNQAEKATQMGARFAAVTNPVAQEIATDTYSNLTVGGVLVAQGDRIPAGDFKIVCTSTGATCACTGSDCVRASYTKDATAFGDVRDRMRAIYPAITDANVQIEYTGSGLGFAGDPSGPDIAPIITIRLTGMSHTPITLSPFGTAVSLPDFAYSITAEDANGTASN